MANNKINNVIIVIAAIFAVGALIFLNSSEINLSGSAGKRYCEDPKIFLSADPPSGITHYGQNITTTVQIESLTSEQQDFTLTTNDCPGKCMFYTKSDLSNPSKILKGKTPLTAYLLIEIAISAEKVKEHKIKLLASTKEYSTATYYKLTTAPKGYYPTNPDAACSGKTGSKFWHYVGGTSEPCYPADKELAKKDGQTVLLSNSEPSMHLEVYQTYSNRNIRIIGKAVSATAPNYMFVRGDNDEDGKYETLLFESNIYNAGREINRTVSTKGIKKISISGNGIEMDLAQPI